MRRRRRRTGLGRHGGLADEAGDPLDGLVNLFDLGIVLAAAFLVAGLGLTMTREEAAREERTPSTVTAPGTRTPLQQPSTPQQASGQGTEVGRVFRLSDGRLVLVRPGGAEP